MVGSSNFWYQNDRINIVFHDMDSDFQISRLVARENEMNDFWRNFDQIDEILIRLIRSLDGALRNFAKNRSFRSLSPPSEKFENPNPCHERQY